MKKQNLILIIILALSFLSLGVGTDKIFSQSDAQACTKACCSSSSSHSHSEKTSPAKSDSAAPPVEHKIQKEEIGKKEVCVMCKMTVVVSKKTPALDYQGKTYYFCDKNEKKEFSRNPQAFVPNADSTLPATPRFGFEAVCSVCGMKLKVEKNTPSLVYKGKTYYFMNEAHKKMFEKDPEKYLK